MRPALRLPPERLLGLGLLILAACGPAMPETRPADFAVVYEWQAGSLPPPYHYAYTLVIGPDGAGALTYLPDYDFNRPPVWTETFTVEAADLDQLYAVLVEQGVLRANWSAVDDPPVGGEVESAQMTVDGRTYAIPFAVSPVDHGRVQAAYAAIRALAPAALWEKLAAQRQAYMDEHPE